jgi:hypothetical protein
MANVISSESAGSAKRRKEKEASAKLRGRKSFDDQSNVDKIYQWIKSGVKSAESGFPAQTKGGTYTHRNP